MILYCDGTHYVSTCHDSSAMRVHFMMVHFMTVQITLKHLIIYGQRMVKCKASARCTVRGLCFFTLLVQASCPLAASIPLISAHAGSLFRFKKEGKSLTGFPHQGVKSSCALWSCYGEFPLLIRHIYTNR